MLFVTFDAVRHLILKGGHGIFHMRSNHSVCSAHKGSVCTDKSGRTGIQSLLLLHPRVGPWPLDLYSQVFSRPATTTRRFLRLRVLRLWAKQDSIDDDG